MLHDIHMHSHTQCRKGGNKLIESLVPFKASTVTVSVGDANMQVLNNNALARLVPAVTHFMSIHHSTVTDVAYVL
jgi:hypothetical protein